MGIFDKKNVVKIEEEDLKDAKLSSMDYADEATKKRAFINVLGARLAIKMLFSKKIEANNVYSLYTIHSLLEDLDIADVYYEGIRIDVRLVFNRNEIFIPKSHFEYDLLPDLYLALELSDDLTCAEPLGFFEPESINKENQNNDFYFFEYEKLGDPKELKSYLKRFKAPAKLDISESNFEQAQELFLSLADKEIDFDNKLFLFKQLANSFELREKIVEFENFEIISNEVAKNESIIGDGVLDIIGAQKVFEEDDKIVSKAEIKAEVIGEVLTDLLDEELSEPQIEPKTEKQRESESEFLSELEAETKPAPVQEQKAESKILENSVKALAAGLELGTVIASGSAAATAAGAVVEGNIAKGTADVISSGVELGASILESSLSKNEPLPVIDLSEISDKSESLEDLIADIDTNNNFEANADIEPENIADEVEEIADFDLDDLISDDNNNADLSGLDFVDSLDSEPEVVSASSEKDISLESFSETNIEDQFEELDDLLADSGEILDENISSNDEQEIEIVEDMSSTLLPDIEEILPDELPEFNAVEDNREDVIPSAEASVEPITETKIELIQETSFDESPGLTALPEIDLGALEGNFDEEAKETESNDYVKSIDDFKIDTMPEIATVDAEEPNEISKPELPKEELSFDAIRNQTDAFADFNMDVIPFDVGVDSSALPVNVGQNQEDSVNDITLNAFEAMTTEPEPIIAIPESDSQNDSFDELKPEVQQVDEVKPEPTGKPVEIPHPEGYTGREAKERELAQREAMIHEQDIADVESEQYVNLNSSVDPEDSDYVEIDVFSEKKARESLINTFSQEIDALPSEIELTAEEEMLLQETLRICEEGYNKVSMNDESATADVSSMSEEDIIKEADLLIEDFNIEDDKDPLQVLFKEEQATELPEMEEVEEKQKVLPFASLAKNKKMVIAASVATVVIVSFAIGANIMGNKDADLADVSNLKPATISTDGQSLGQDLNALSQNIPGNPNANLQGQNTGLDPLTQQPIPGGDQDAAPNKDMGQTVADAFTSEPVNASVSKIAWEVPEDLAYNDGFRKYLQVAGKNLKLNLQTNLLLATEMAYSNKILIDLVINRDGSLQSSTIAASSGSKQVDKIVLQSVKETMRYLKMPASELGGGYADATLIINF